MEGNTFSEESGQKSCNLGILEDKAAVEVGKTQEDLDIRNRTRRRPKPYCRYLLWIHGDTIWGDNIAKEFNLILVEGTFLSFGPETIGTQSVQYQLDMFRVFFIIVRKDQNVIKIDHNKLIQEFSKDIVHEVLEGCGGIGESIRHHERFK